MDIDTHVAEQFGQAIVKGDFAAAHALLAKEAQQKYSPDALKETVADMIAYADGPLQRAEVMDAHDDWPAKRDGDVAWVYVALTGESFSEAATVILAAEDGSTRIRKIEWGRP